MNDSLSNREIHRETNCSIRYALYLALWRQPWKAMSLRTWRTIRNSFLLIVMICMMSPLAHAAEPRIYDAVSADVPFKFHVGKRAFRPGHYQFIFVGNGLLAMRDAHNHLIASLVTRSVDAGVPAAAGKLVFAQHNQSLRLAEIRMQNQSQVVEILGEQLAISVAPPPTPPATIVFPFSDRSGGLRFRQ